MSPRTTSSAPPTLVRIDPDARIPLYRQIYDSLRDAIVSGRLAPRAPVPPTRVLAQELQVSRNTTAAALAQLRAEGYLEVRPRSGTFVSPRLPEVAVVGSRRRARLASGSNALAALSRRGARMAALQPSPTSAARPFRFGVPALDAFPWALWARLTSRWLRRSAAALGGYASASGFAPLRQAIARHVRAARGGVCEPEQVLVTGGAQQALDLVARLLLDDGDAVWVEDPGYPSARAAFAAVGARVVPVPLDAEGLDVAAGVRRAPRARLIYVTPSRQYPVGVTMSAARRLELLDWAAGSGAWVVEDDYDSEFRYVSRPLACLQGLDENGRVLYVGTFSKTLFPALRLGYVIVPAELVDAFTTARTVVDWHSPAVEQAVLAEFMAGGHFARHIRRMRVLYEARRDALCEALRSLLGDVIEIGDATAGMHLVGWLRKGVSDRRVAELAHGGGLDVAPLSGFAVNPLARGGLVLGYTEFPAPVLWEAARRLAAALR